MGTLSVDKILKTSQGAAEFTLPATDGTAGQSMITDGSGQLSLGNPTLPVDSVTASEIAAGAVGTSEIAALAVTASEIAATTITPAQMADSAFLANRNLVMNGAMQISQRATSTASITGVGFHTVDRWETQATTLGTWTQSQATDTPAGFGSSLKMDCTTANASPAASANLGVRIYFE